MSLPPIHPLLLSLCLWAAPLLSVSTAQEPDRPAASWGQIQATPIFLEAPMSLIEELPLPSSMTRWTVNAKDAPNIQALFEELGVPTPLAQYLAAAENQVMEGPWVHLFPPGQEVFDLEPEVRKALYAKLAEYGPNQYQQDPVLIVSDTVKEWYADGSLRPELVQKIEALSYRRGDAWAFSDLSLMLNFAESESEARLLFKAFTRVRTYLASMTVADDADVDTIRNYWTVGAGFRLKDIDPLLQSIKEQKTGVQLDLVHLLPPLPRRLMYTYPRPELATKGVLPDCHWTSLNFFNYEPHDSYLDARLATNRVLEKYNLVDAPYRYGDILFFMDKADGQAYHSCVYLADDLVFTKNGRNQLSPWMLSTIADVTRTYLAMATGYVQGYRRKDALDSE